MSARAAIFAAVVMALAARSAAAHSMVFVPIALEEMNGPVEGRLRVTFGVPLPHDTEAFDPGRVVLVGARAFHVRALARWPDGRLRWVGVDALVDVGRGGRKPALYLASGRGAPPAAFERQSDFERPALAARALDASWYNQAEALPVRIVTPEAEEALFRTRGWGAPPAFAPGTGAPLDDVIEFLRRGGARGVEHLRAAERRIAREPGAHAETAGLLDLLRGEEPRSAPTLERDRVEPVASFLRGDGADALRRAADTLRTGSARSVAERQALAHLLLNHARPPKVGGELDHEAYAVVSDPPGSAPLIASALVLAAVVGGGRRLVRGLPVALVLLAVGCEGKPAAPAPGTRTATAGPFQVQVVLPDPIPSNEHFAIQVQVTPGDVTITADADMPEHRHGMPTAPEVRALGGGRFEGRGFLFHMPGRWEITVDVIRGDRRERATFPVETR